MDLKDRHLLIVGHADGDGYLAAEQSRRNAAAAGAASCHVLVDPTITPGYRFWERYLERLEVEEYDAVIFVDLMLNYKAPRDSFDRLRAKAINHPDKNFLVIDHHPVGGLPGTPDNLEFRFTDTVYECCLGDPSELMIIASICDRDEGPVQHLINDVHRRRAIGVSRAASDRYGLAGNLLIRLIREEQWEILEALGQEDRQYHRTVRGIRPSSSPVTPALQAARQAVAGG